jgi:hypothetical protein
MFRKVYPFSPALVQTLIAVSSVLQRERTALKVMRQLLVDQRDTLRVGDLVPVGDLFDVVAHGDEAFSAEMAIHFDNARGLYHHKLLPMLEKQHGRVEELEQLLWDDRRRTAFRNDDRLVKTFGITRPPTDACSDATTRQSTVPRNEAKASRKANEITVPACRGQQNRRRATVSRTWVRHPGARSHEHTHREHHHVHDDDAAGDPAAPDSAAPEARPDQRGAAGETATTRLRHCRAAHPLPAPTAVVADDEIDGH